MTSSLSPYAVELSNHLNQILPPTATPTEKRAQQVIWMNHKLKQQGYTTKIGQNVRDFVTFLPLLPDIPEQQDAMEEVFAGKLPSIDQFYEMFAVLCHLNDKTVDMDKVCMPRFSRIEAIKDRLLGGIAQPPAGYSGAKRDNKAAWTYEVKHRYILNATGEVCQKKEKSIDQPFQYSLEGLYQIIAVNHVEKDHMTNKFKHYSRDDTSKRIRYNNSNLGNETVTTQIVKDFIASCPGCEAKAGVEARKKGTETTRQNGGNSGPKERKHENHSKKRTPESDLEAESRSRSPKRARTLSAEPNNYQNPLMGHGMPQASNFSPQTDSFTQQQEGYLQAIARGMSPAPDPASPVFYPQQLAEPYIQYHQLGSRTEMRIDPKYWTDKTSQIFDDPMQFPSLDPLFPDQQSGPQHNPVDQSDGEEAETSPTCEFTDINLEFDNWYTDGSEPELGQIAITSTTDDLHASSVPVEPISHSLNHCETEPSVPIGFDCLLEGNEADTIPSQSSENIEQSYDAEALPSPQDPQSPDSLLNELSGCDAGTVANEHSLEGGFEDKPSQLVEDGLLGDIDYEALYDEFLDETNQPHNFTMPEEPQQGDPFEHLEQNLDDELFGSID